MVSCILLSAGLSQRFGSPKALADIQGETILCRLQNMLLSTQVGEIIIVLGAHADSIKPQLLNHTKIKFVYNKDYNFGQTSSFKAGIEALSSDSEASLLLPVDYPLIQSETVNQIIGAYLSKKPTVLIPEYMGKKGHPPAFSLKLKDEFLALSNDQGVNQVAHAYSGDTLLLPVEDPGTTSTFNTPEEFEALKILFAKSRDERAN